MTKPRRPNTGHMRTKERIIDRLTTLGPMTQQELQHELGTSKDMLRDAMNALHEEGVVYISDWPYQGLQRSRQWAYRTSPEDKDKPKPKPRTNEEHQHNYRERHKLKMFYKRANRAGNPFAGLVFR